MRVYNGSYEIVEGIRFHKPYRFYEYSVSDREAKVAALIEQGACDINKLDGRIVRYSITSPVRNVLRIVMRHHAPRKTVKYETAGTSVVLETIDAESSLVIRSGELSLVFDKHMWHYSFSSGKHAASSGTNSAGFFFDGKSDLYMTEKLSLNPGGLVYGMGERFSPLVRNGQHVEIRNTDPATESDLGYKNIPFYLTNEGYGVFVNSPGFVDFEVCTEDANAVRFSLRSNELDYYFIYGPSPKEIIARYTEITGRPPLIPKWSLGTWLSTSFVTDYDEKVITANIEGMAKRNIPLTVFHFDCFWMKERHWCDFLWNKAAFPDPEGMLARLKKAGLKICLWINPYISELSAVFEEAAAAGYLVRNRDGCVYQIDWWQPGLAFVDFTDPAACEWFKSKLRPLLDMGVDTFKTDFGEGVPTDAVYRSGANGEEMHNLYTFLYNKTVFELLEERFGRGNAVVFARSATACSQRFPVHWGGDSRAEFVSMAGQLRGGLSFGASGCAFWSHDIGGFFGTPDPDLFKRWIAFGLLSSHARLHGNDTVRVPWNFDEESSEVLRRFTEVRHALVPYIYSLCYEASQTGTPVMRPMFMEFPDDNNCRYLDMQYMLGPSLLVAPVFSKDGRVELYLPEGTWTDYWSGKRVTGGKWVGEVHGYMSIPLFVRENCILPVGPVDRAPLGKSREGLVIYLYDIGAGARFVLWDDEEIVVSARRSRDGLQIDLSKPIPGLFIGLPGTEKKWPCERSTTFIKTDNLSRSGT